MAVGVNGKTISQRVKRKGKQLADGFSHTKASARPSPRASQGWTSACGGCCPGARGGGRARCRMPQNKGASRGLRRGHLLPPGQIKEDWRGHLEEMVLFFMGNQFVPPLMGHTALPPWASQATGFQVSPNQFWKRRHLRLPVLFRTARAPQNLCYVSLPFSPSFGLLRLLYPGFCNNEAGSGTFPHSLSLRFLFSQ